MESTVPVPALAETPQLPVTVSFTRRADPAHAVEMTAWIRAGLTMAEAFPGFLGGGWVRPRHDAHEWHMLCRFDSPATMTAWEASPRATLVARVGPGAGRGHPHRAAHRHRGLVRRTAGRRDGAARAHRTSAVEAGGHHLAGLLPAQPAGHGHPGRPADRGPRRPAGGGDDADPHPADDLPAAALDDPAVGLVAPEGPRPPHLSQARGDPPDGAEPARPLTGVTPGRRRG